MKTEDGNTTDLDLKYKLLIKDINKQTKEEEDQEDSEDNDIGDGKDEEEEKSNDHIFLSITNHIS